MPLVDWTCVDAGIFHAFHLAWIAALQLALNEGILPEGFYALAEQHATRYIPDVLTLHASSPGGELHFRPLPGSGGTLVAESPPRTRRTMAITPSRATRRRSLAIRHVTEHRLIALIEILSPSNKDRRASVDDFAQKIVSALDCKVHVLIVDLFPPGRNDPNGMHDEIWRRVGDEVEPYNLPAGEPLTLASYAASEGVEAYIDHVAVGSPLRDMPLFLTPDRYVNVPLEATYQMAYPGTPKFWRDVLESGAE